MSGRIEARYLRMSLAALALALLGALTLFISPSGTALADTSREKCASDGAVPDAANNPGLVADCAVLLDVKKTLEGKNGRELNWSSSLPISRWEGITVGSFQWGSNYYNSPNRVTIIDLYGGRNSKKLRGKIPKHLGNLSELRYLILSYNELRGKIRPQLGNLSQLRVLGLSVNELSGRIPPQLGKLSELEAMYLYGNELSGRIPKSLGKLSNLKILALEHNKLTGEIPKQLGNLSSLENMSLRRNQLTGNIPPELGKLPKIKALELHFNNLTGCVPKSLRSFKYFSLSDQPGGGKYRLMYENNPDRLSYDELFRKHKNGEIPFPLHKLPWCS